MDIINIVSKKKKTIRESQSQDEKVNEGNQTKEEVGQEEEKLEETIEIKGEKEAIEKGKE